MARWKELIDDRQPVRFEIEGPVEDAICRLSDATEAPGFRLAVRPHMCGRVSEEGVRLERVAPLFRNSWKPVFVGHFEKSDGQVFLVGTFGVATFTRVFMYVFVTFGVLWSVGASWSVLARPGPSLPVWFPFAGIGIAGIGVAMSKLGAKLSNGDVPWLTRQISDALQG